MRLPDILEQRLDALESRNAIAELIHGYARCIRRDLPDEVGALFTEDGVFELREGAPDRPDHVVRSRLEGRAAIHAHMASNKGKPHPIPLIHNLIVELGGDTATASCVMRATIQGTTHVVSGEYRDSFRREHGKWRFVERLFTMFGAAPAL